MRLLDNIRGGNGGGVTSLVGDAVLTIAGRVKTIAKTGDTAALRLALLGTTAPGPATWFADGTTTGIPFVNGATVPSGLAGLSAVDVRGTGTDGLGYVSNTVNVAAVVGVLGFTVSEAGVQITSFTDNGDGTDTYALTGDPYAGTHTVDNTARLDDRPQLIVPAVWVQTGDTFNLTRPLWLEPDADPATFVGRILVNGTEAAGDVETFTYAGSGLVEYEYSAFNVAGVTAPPNAIVKAEAFPAVVQFRDSFLQQSNETDTRKKLFFFRASVVNNAVNGVILYSGNISILNTTSSTTRFRMTNHVTSTNHDTTITRAQAAAGFSVIMAADLDGGITNPLTGATGLTYLCLLNVGGTWTTGFAIVQDTSSVPSATVSRTDSLGSINSGGVGPSIDISHHYWRTNNAFSVPDVYAGAFNADGTIKNIAYDGTIGSTSPTFYMAADGFLSLANRGTSTVAATADRTAITVVLP
jgi:hypothetical protein